MLSILSRQACTAILRLESFSGVPHRLVGAQQGLYAREPVRLQLLLQPRHVLGNALLRCRAGRGQIRLWPRKGTR